MTSAEKRAKREEQEAFDARLAKVMEAASDERSRFNKAIQRGHRATLITAFGSYDVKFVDTDFWYHTVPTGGSDCGMNQRTFCGCNDGKWAGLLLQVGEPRNPLFAN